MEGGISIVRDRSQDSFVSIHFWRGDLGTKCSDRYRHSRIASPNPRLWRKREAGQAQGAAHPMPNQPSTVSPT